MAYGKTGPEPKETTQSAMGKEKHQNENPDSGFDHFHEHGRKPPMAHAKGVAFKKAPDSGPHTMGAQEGMDPRGLPSYPNVTPVGS